MTIEQIIKETEILSESEQKTLLSYYIIRYLKPDSSDLIKLFLNADYSPFIKKETTATKINKNYLKNGKPQSGIFKGKLHTPDDFNEPIEDLKEYM